MELGIIEFCSSLDRNRAKPFNLEFLDSCISSRRRLCWRANLASAAFSLGMEVLREGFGEVGGCSRMRLWKPLECLVGNLQQ